MVSTRLSAHPHHLEFATTIAADVRSHVERLGRMRGLVVVRIGANGGYRAMPMDLESATPGRLMDLGLSLLESLDVIEGLHRYDPESVAAALVVETNPIDGSLFSFLTLEWGPPLAGMA